MIVLEESRPKYKVFIEKYELKKIVETILDDIEGRYIYISPGHHQKNYNFIYNEYNDDENAALSDVYKYLNASNYAQYFKGALEDYHDKTKLLYLFCFPGIYFKVNLHDKNNYGHCTIVSLHETDDYIHDQIEYFK